MALGRAAVAPPVANGFDAVPIGFDDVASLMVGAGAAGFGAEAMGAVAAGAGGFGGPAVAVGVGAAGFGGADAVGAGAGAIGFGAGGAVAAGAGGLGAAGGGAGVLAAGGCGPGGGVGTAALVADGFAGGASDAFSVTRTVSFLSGMLDVCLVLPTWLAKGTLAVCRDGGAEAPGGLLTGGCVPGCTFAGVTACFMRGIFVVCFVAGAFAVSFLGASAGGLASGTLDVCLDGTWPACFKSGTLVVCLDGGEDGAGGLFSGSLIRNGIFRVALPTTKTIGWGAVKPPKREFSHPRMNRPMIDG